MGRMLAASHRDKPRYVSLHRLCALSGRSRVTLLLRMRDGELHPDAVIDLGDREMPIFDEARVSEVRRMQLRKNAPARNPML